MPLLDRLFRSSETPGDRALGRGPGRDCPSAGPSCPGSPPTFENAAIPSDSIAPLLSRWLTALAGHAQPRVDWRRDRRGHSYYRVYDPQTQRTHRFETAQAVRVWLEGRYGR